MKPIPTSSQTVGPFFSIGLEPLCQNVEEALTKAPDSIVLGGVVLDGNKEPIPDCVLEFFAANSFARVATSSEGKYRVAIPANAGMCEVLVFMRGLLKPTLTRVYFHEGALNKDAALENAPSSRLPTLIARRLDSGKLHEWDVVMQGENETVFFEF